MVIRVDRYPREKGEIGLSDGHRGDEHRGGGPATVVNESKCRYVDDCTTADRKTY